MSAMQTTLPEEVAAKVAADVTEYGEGYVKIDREGRAEHVPWSLIGAFVEMKRKVMRDIVSRFRARQPS